MRKNLERRLRNAEIKRAGTESVEVWIILNNGMMRGPRGETISRDAFEEASSGLNAVIILPDNGRDATRS
jgi:hypothetical protein